MYQSYYGFTEMPFHITPDPKFLYLSAIDGIRFFEPLGELVGVMS